MWWFIPRPACMCALHRDPRVFHRIPPLTRPRLYHSVAAVIGPWSGSISCETIFTCSCLQSFCYAEGYPSRLPGCILRLPVVFVLISLVQNPMVIVLSFISDLVIIVLLNVKDLTTPEERKRMWRDEWFWFLIVPGEWIVNIFPILIFRLYQGERGHHVSSDHQPFVEERKKSLSLKR